MKRIWNIIKFLYRIYLSIVSIVAALMVLPYVIIKTEELMVLQDSRLGIWIVSTFPLQFLFTVIILAIWNGINAFNIIDKGIQKVRRGVKY